MKRNKAFTQARDTQVIKGIAAHFNGTATFTFDGITYKAKELQQLLQGRIDAASATASARAKWLTAAAAEEERANEVESILLGLKSHLVTTYGKKSQIVADFGFTPKAKQTTAATTAKAVVKRAATRKARGTMGKREKQKITGAVAPEVVTATPATPAPVVVTGSAPVAPTST